MVNKAEFKLKFNKPYFFPVLVVLFFFSCKKDKLDNEAQLLIGRWKIIESGGVTYSPSDPEYFELEFLECGKIRKWKDGKCKERGYFKKIIVEAIFLDRMVFDVEAKSSSPFEDDGFCDLMVTCEIIFANTFYNPKTVNILHIFFKGCGSHQCFSVYEKISD